MNQTTEVKVRERLTTVGCIKTILIPIKDLNSYVSYVHIKTCSLVF